MSWRRVEVSSWADFVEFVERLMLHRELDLRWFIRGQSDESWALRPSLMRQLGEVTFERALGIEMGASRRFMSQYHLHATANGVDQSSRTPVAWWILMQHHSCPTRLLDWTLSPYVALYFAVDQLPDRDGAVWFFPSPALQLFTESRHGILPRDFDGLCESPDTNAVYPVVAVQDNERSASQQGVFTVGMDVQVDHGEAISKAFAAPQNDCPLSKVIIPAGLKDEFLSRLRAMNITPRSLFPGLDGLGRSVRDYVRVRAWLTHNERVPGQ